MSDNEVQTVFLAVVALIVLCVAGVKGCQVVNDPVVIKAEAEAYAIKKTSSLRPCSP